MSKFKRVKTKPVALFVPFTRVADAGAEAPVEERIVEGYVYVNATTPFDNWDVPRDVMETATPEYMRFGAVREMHTSSAAGTCLELEWDDKGAKIRTLVVDDQAWAKVTNGVYKGFSIGWAITRAAGNKVQELIWVENSLVDRPADADALIESFRCARNAEAPAEFETVIEEVATQVDTEDEAKTEDDDPENKPLVEDAENAPETDPLQRVTSALFGRAVAEFNSVISKRENSSLQYLAFDTLEMLLYQLGCDDEWSDAAGLTPAEREAAARAAIQQFADYVVPLVVARAAWDRAAETSCTRAALAANLVTVDADKSRALTTSRELAGRVERSESDLTGARAQVATLTEQLRAATVKPPVRYPGAMERTFAANAENAAPEVQGLVARYQTLKTTLKDEPDAAARSAGVQEMQRIKLQLADQGIAL